jgi:hypothetical protein
MTDAVFALPYRISPGTDVMDRLIEGIVLKIFHEVTINDQGIPDLSGKFFGTIPSQFTNSLADELILNKFAVIVIGLVIGHSSGYFNGFTIQVFRIA